MSTKLLDILNKIDAVISIFESEIATLDAEKKEDAYNSSYYIELSGRISAMAIALDYTDALRLEVSDILNEFLDNCMNTDDGATIALLEAEIKLLRARLQIEENQEIKKAKIKNPNFLISTSSIFFQKKIGKIFLKLLLVGTILCKK